MLEKIHHQAEVYTANSDILAKLNQRILNHFLARHLQDDVKRTHLFNGRYENIYLNEQHIPELALFENIACEYAKSILGVDQLNMGYWFNYMLPGSVTTAHNHDDDEELLSGVYYVCVPENSGDIIIVNSGEDIQISPTQGSFLFFKPNILHSVTENKSAESRLSIGINFGKKF